MDNNLDPDTSATPADRSQALVDTAGRLQGLIGGSGSDKMKPLVEALAAAMMEGNLPKSVTTAIRLLMNDDSISTSTALQERGVLLGAVDPGLPAELTLGGEFDAGEEVKKALDADDGARERISDGLIEFPKRVVLARQTTAISRSRGVPDLPAAIRQWVLAARVAAASPPLPKEIEELALAVEQGRVSHHVHEPDTQLMVFPVHPSRWEEWLSADELARYAKLEHPRAAASATKIRNLKNEIVGFYDKKRNKYSRRVFRTNIEMFDDRRRAP